MRRGGGRDSAPLPPGVGPVGRGPRRRCGATRGTPPGWGAQPEHHPGRNRYGRRGRLCGHAPAPRVSAIEPQSSPRLVPLVRAVTARGPAMRLGGRTAQGPATRRTRTLRTNDRPRILLDRAQRRATRDPKVLEVRTLSWSFRVLSWIQNQNPPAANANAGYSPQSGSDSATSREPSARCSTSGGVLGRP
jgi:hypothetical protein